MALSEFPAMRLRRLRRTPAMRALLDEPEPGPQQFLWPVFVVPGRQRQEPIQAMPGQSRVSVDRICAHAEKTVKQGVGGLLVFGLTDESRKDPAGSQAWNSGGAAQNAVAALKDAFPHLLVATDVCLCAYTDHGHCGPLTDDGAVNNDAALSALARTACSHVAAGADLVAPSAMMDGQVQAIRAALDEAGAAQVPVMSYSTKFASSMYGPFREAEQSSPQQGDRQGYQASYGNARAALRESEQDAAEGADILMIKPALFYLDILNRLRERTDLPLAAYNVSGEYAMLIAAAERGWGELAAMARESLCAIRRAGADIIISYWASRYKEIFG